MLVRFPDRIVIERTSASLIFFSEVPPRDAALRLSRTRYRFGEIHYAYVYRRVNFPGKLLSSISKVLYEFQ